MSFGPPTPRCLGELREIGYRPRSVREELRENLLDRIRAGKPIFDHVLGYEDTVIPAVENALLCGHDLIFLGERGQAKSRMIRALTGLLDEWLPCVAGSEVNDDPFAPISAYARALLAEHGDACEIVWMNREDRYVEKLATPDVSIADLIGDVDPVKVAEGRSLGDEMTIHFGLVPRTHRGIFCINELPDLTEKVQVGLFNVMEERDIQVKGYRVRIPVDVFVVASANPEDYTTRGRIITPLKDRYRAQIRTHYPKTRDLELAIVRQEYTAPRADGIDCHIPSFMEDVIGELTFQARSSPDVNQTSGVSVRMSIANYETLLANALRRALRQGEDEAVPRISDLDAIGESTAGKLEIEYAGSDRSELEVARDLVRRATRSVFDSRFSADDLGTVVDAFDGGWAVEVSGSMPSREVLVGLEEIPGLRDAAVGLAGGDSPGRVASALEFILEGLHLTNRLNKKTRERGSRYAKA
ncbi:MAG: sigma 54-interacting transcriptional regulator [Myxococcota bacterium]